MDRAANEDGAIETAAVEAPEAGPPAMKTVDAGALEAHIIDAISLVYDPEIPVNVYDMGLIYNIEITADGNVAIDMTLTSPACPVAGTLPGEVEAKVREVAGVADVAVELVWEPFWTPERMTEAARLQLGMM
ncbi:MAG: SUF system Fe-S cluster assembly protein [Alphaproteobacteria bacterium]